MSIIVRHRPLSRRIALVSCCLLAACSGSGHKSCPIGDLSQTPEIQLFHANAAGEEVLTQPMDQVPLIQPEQGGWVFYVEPHIRNMDGCELQLRTSLTDICSNQVVVFESRPSTLMDDGSGWGIPISSSSDGLVAACPQSQITRDLDGEAYLLDVIAEDSEGGHAEASVEVVPTCTDPFCFCQCDRTYNLGATCGSDVDAGVPMMGCP